jgi:NAD(P)-dependent dehydrogenase (short-subunit alcohol dehydrogenase family)
MTMLAEVPLPVGAASGDSLGMSSGYLEGLFGLKGQVAVVIGGTGELCGAIAEGYAAAGAEVVLVGRQAAKAAPRLERIAQAGGKAWFFAAEASERASLERLRDAVLERSGGFDIVVNGAGVNSATPFLDIKEDEFERILRINIGSVFLGCQVLGGHLVTQGRGGSIVNLGSMSGFKPLSRVFTYSLTKAAVHNLTKNLAREWAPAGVRVNTLVPGFFPAEQNRKVLSPERIDSILKRTPMGRFGRADELVGAAILLAARGAGSFVTGTEVTIDGGFQSMDI